MRNVAFAGLLVVAVSADLGAQPADLVAALAEEGTSRLSVVLADGKVVSGRLDAVGTEHVVLAVGERRVVLPIDQIGLIERAGDSPMDGLVRGGLAGLSLGLAALAAQKDDDRLGIETPPAERVTVLSVVTITLASAGIGLIIDAAKNSRTTLYVSPAVFASPSGTRHPSTRRVADLAPGVRVAVTF